MGMHETELGLIGLAPEISRLFVAELEFFLVSRGWCGASKAGCGISLVVAPGLLVC
jgi:hypothetical protein